MWRLGLKHGYHMVQGYSMQIVEIRHFISQQCLLTSNCLITKLCCLYATSMIGILYAHFSIPLHLTGSNAYELFFLKLVSAIANFLIYMFV